MCISRITRNISIESKLRMGGTAEKAASERRRGKYGGMLAPIQFVSRQVPFNDVAFDNRVSKLIERNRGTRKKKSNGLK